MPNYSMSDWAAAGLNVATSVKRGIYTVSGSLFIKVVGKLVDDDVRRLEQSLLIWLGL